MIFIPIHNSFFLRTQNEIKQKVRMSRKLHEYPSQKFNFSSIINEARKIFPLPSFHEMMIMTMMIVIEATPFK